MYATKHSAGYDLIMRDVIDKDEINHILTVDTGLVANIPEQHFGLVAIRSSLAKQGFSLANGVGIIDSDYKDTIKLMFKCPINRGYVLVARNRIAQLVIIPYVNMEDALIHSVDRIGGWGSTGE